MIPLGSRSGPAVRHLFASPTFRNHPQAVPALTITYGGDDYGYIDPDRLADDAYAWSSGERVLIMLALAIAQAGPFDVRDLTRLDTEHRHYAVSAIASWLGVCP